MYVVALQRQVKQPKIIHIRRLNTIVRVAQRSPKHVLFRAMECLREVQGHADSGFSKEQDSGYGIRGLNLVRKGKELTSGRTVWHLLESQCRSHKLVTRNTFSSETLAVAAGIDELLPLALTLHEVTSGAVSAEEARTQFLNGTCSFRTILVTDSMSLWSALAAFVVKVPAEKTMAIHLFWMRELLDRRALAVLGGRTHAT